MIIATQLVLVVNLIGAVVLTAISIYQTFYSIKNKKKLPTLTARIFLLFKPLLGKTQRGKPWGVVYDSVTKTPIDPAIVTIAVHENGVGEFKQERITDVEGRFSFLVTPGHYVLTAEKTNYTFPSKIVTGQSDGKYKNIYHGEVIEVENPYIINLNIPMDPAGFDWNQSIKPHSRHASFEFVKENIRNFFILNGILLSLLAYSSMPDKLALAAVPIYLFNLLFIKTYMEQKLWGTIYYKITKQPAERLTIKAIRKPYNLTVATTQSDHLGRYFLLLAKGTYAIEVSGPKKEGDSAEILAKLEDIKVTKKKEVVNFDIGI